MGACSVCHTTPAVYTTYTSNMTALHSVVAPTCSTCHGDGKGPFAAAPGFALIQLSSRGPHLPITRGGAPVECSGCHKVVTSFSGTIMSHAAIGDTRTSATGNACDACHELGFDNRFVGVTINWTRNDSQHFICGAPGTPTAPNIAICNGGGSDCLTGCHQHDNNIPAKYASIGPKVPKKQIQSATAAPTAPVATPSALPRRMSIGGLTDAADATGRVDHARLAGRACVTCHTGAAATGKGPTHLATTGACADCHSTMAWRPVMRLDHADVLGACASCHNGTRAPGKATLHPLSGADCDRCHTTSAWKPAAFDHAAVLAGACATCHNALQAPGRPAGHVASMLSCDTCHYVLGWKPTKPVRLVMPPANPSTPANPATAPKPPGRPLPVPPVRPQAVGTKSALQ